VEFAEESDAEMTTTNRSQARGEGGGMPVLMDVIDEAKANPVPMEVSDVTGKNDGTSTKTASKGGNAAAQETSSASLIPASVTGDAMRVSAANAEEEQPLVMDMDDTNSLDQFLLAMNGFTARDVEQFKLYGVHTVNQVRTTLSKELYNMDIAEDKIDRMLKALKRTTKPANYGFITALQVKKERQQLPRISTGSKGLDGILGGGVESGSLTEFFGEFCCGKTQICHTMSVIAQLPPDMGGNNGRVLYLDTEGTFRPERIQQIAEERGLPPDTVMDNILVARAINSEHLMELLIEAGGHMCSSEEQFALIIVDSIMAGFRVDYKSDEIMLRQTTLGRVLAKLQKLSEEFKVAVVLSNQVASQGMNSVIKNENPKPIGGHVIAHASTTRVSLRKGPDETKLAKIYDSPYLPEGECCFAIGDRGIYDP